MTEYEPNREHEDTQPIPRDTPSGEEPRAQAPQPPHVQPPADAEHTHRYGQPGQPGQPSRSGAYDETTAYDTRGWGSSGGGPFFGAPYPQAAPSAPSGGRSRSGLTAGVLVGALVLGGLAGLGGAATYDLVNPDASTSTGDNRTATSVVEREDTPAEEGSVEAVANSVLPSVVKINVRGAQGGGSGSGVVISGDGEILTNDHVVDIAADGGTVSVGFNDGSTASAKVVGTDPLTDLAVIKAEGVSGLTPAPLGQSGNLDVGEQVVAIGSPFGLDATVTSGIVSALNRPVSVQGQGSAMNTTYPAIQTDAAINPGNSGGPLVNMQGEVVGINSSIRTGGGTAGSIGLGFAIPLDEVLPIVDQLRNGEQATHARLGVSVTDAASEDGLLSGAGVAEVTSGSAAEEAGLEQGDVIVKVDDHPISDASSLVATIRGHRPDDEVTLTVVRDGEEMQVQATLDSDAGQPVS